MSDEHGPPTRASGAPDARAGKGGLWLWLGAGLLVAGLGLIYLGWKDGQWRRNPRRIEAAATVQRLKTAIEAYREEYDHLPSVASAGGRIDTAHAGGVELLGILMAMEPPGEVLKNPDKLPFLALPESRSQQSGLIHGKSGATIEGLLDPWGRAYEILLDTSGSGSIRNPGGGDPIRDSIAVFTVGPDGKIGTWDDVTSWSP